jgi:ATP-dependent DNA helicase RecG
MLRLFISSVQKEFASERAALRSNVDVGGSVAAQPESRPESQPESLAVRFLRLLVEGPLPKSELSSGLRQKEISGPLNKVIRLLLAAQSVEYTIPDKPNSRLQKYRLTAKGRAALATLQPKGNA